MPFGSRDSWGSRCVEVCEVGRYALGWYSKFDVKQIIIKEKLLLLRKAHPPPHGIHFAQPPTPHQPPL